MNHQEKNKIRRQFCALLEQQLDKMIKPEDRLFSDHTSEGRIILSHALFWVMTKSLSGKIAKEKYFLLLRQYEEEMLTAYLTESEDYPDLLHYCNVLYESLPITIGATHNQSQDKSARQLTAIAITACGYTSYISEDSCHDLLDDIDFHYNKPYSPKIEHLLPELNEMVADEIEMYK